MLKRCVQLFGIVRNIDSEPKRKKEIKRLPFPNTESGENSMTLNLSLKSKGCFVRIIHRGGREELYPHEVQAFQLMKKYPGTCVAKPEVFKNPHESLLWPEAKLVPGEKYYIIPSTTFKKLQRKHPEKAKASSFDEGKEETWGDTTLHSGEVNFEESVYSAKEFYAPKGKSPRSLLIKGIRKKKPFVPPLPKSKSFKGPGWEPSLTSVQEISP